MLVGALSNRCSTAAATTRCAGASASWRSRPSRRRRRPDQRGRHRPQPESTAHSLQHPDLLEKIHALQADPLTIGAPARGYPSLTTGRSAHCPRTRRSARAASSSWKSSCPEALGEQTWRESGLGAPTDIDALTGTLTSSNNTTSTFDNNSTNAARTSPPPAPTANRDPTERTNPASLKTTPPVDDYAATVTWLTPCRALLELRIEPIEVVLASAVRSSLPSNGWSVLVSTRVYGRPTRRVWCPTGSSARSIL